MIISKAKITAIVTVATVTAGRAIKVWQDNVKPVPVEPPASVIHEHYYAPVTKKYFYGGSNKSIGPNSGSNGGPGEGASSGSDMILYSVSENHSIFCNLFIDSNFVTVYVFIHIFYYYCLV